MKRIEIDFSINLAGCWPRRLWQVLFDMYRDNGGDLSQMDNMLLDYDNCKKLFKDPKLVVELLWSFSADTGYTTWATRDKWLAAELKEAVAVAAYEHVFLVKFDKNKAVIVNLTKKRNKT